MRHQYIRMPQFMKLSDLAVRLIIASKISNPSCIKLFQHCGSLSGLGSVGRLIGGWYRNNKRVDITHGVFLLADY
jgi:hypothetical protein